MKVSIKQYSQTLFDLTDGKSEQEVLDVVRRFAEQLKKDGQLKNAGKIMEKFSDIYNAKNGIVEAEVTTKYKIQDTRLPDGQARYKQIEEFIKEKYSANEVVIKNIVDEKIQGGIIIRVGDEVLDGTVNSQLNRLKKQLIS